jgi:hypothetical protein
MQDQFSQELVRDLGKKPAGYPTVAECKRNISKNLVPLFDEMVTYEYNAGKVLD